MTIAELESTLRTLCTRHQNLDAGLLTTLLTSAGWEDKVIRDAVSLFTSDTKKYRPEGWEVKTTLPPQEVKMPSPADIAGEHKDVSLPVGLPNTTEIVYYKDGGEEEQILPPLPVEDDVKREDKVEKLMPPPKVIIQPEVIKEETVTMIDLNQKVEPMPKEVVQRAQEEITEVTPVPPRVIISEEVLPIKVIEPQSLIVQEERIETPLKKLELPENLPLKPFESTPHIWPFSKYKEVFHGEVMPPLPTDERALVTSVTVSPEVIAKPIVKKIKIKRTGFDGEDEGLIFLTGTTLLIILLLLAYMYSNGRL